MALFDDLKLNDASNNAEDTERNVTSGGYPAEGMHHAVLNGHREVNANSGSRGRELTFEILAGPSKGIAVKETVWLPDGSDEAKDKKKTDRLRLFCHRLGLLKKVEKDGKKLYVPVEGKSDLLECVGAEVVIDVQLEDDEYQNDKGKTIKTKRARLTYEGLIPIDDKRVANVPKGKPGERPTPAVAGANGKPAAKGGRDFSDM